MSTPVAWLGIACYTLQIYFDFSGYSDMALGLMRMFGFRILENFNYPYIARSVREFWRRWHISLSSWLRDYLYIPLGGSRRGEGRTYVNLLVTFLLGGLWHGAAWTFLLWGAFHGLYLALERLVLGWLGRVVRPSGGAFRSLVVWLGRIWIFHVVCFSWILFRGGNLETAGALLRGLAAWRGAVPDVTLWGGTAVAMVVIGGSGNIAGADSRASRSGNTPANCSRAARLISRRARASPSATISPISSATGMNSAGETMPFSGWRQRSSDSKPLIRSAAMSTSG